MKIVLPEFSNIIIQQALKKCPDVTGVPAKDVDEACQILISGEADGMVAGIDTTTRDVILECREHVPLTNKYFTSAFVMEKDGKKLILADGGVCKTPNVDMMTQIILQTYKTAQCVLNETPRIAVLSFSTFGSGGEDNSISIARRAIEQVRTKQLGILIDGEMQLDAAVDPRIARHKGGESEVAGHANVLICPDLNSGNILYKGLEHLGGWTAAGPILQGFVKPISDLSRGSSVEDVVSVFEILKRLSRGGDL